MTIFIFLGFPGFPGVAVETNVRLVDGHSCQPKSFPGVGLHLPAFVGNQICGLEKEQTHIGGPICLVS